ncbi:FMN-binding negative transcriptional regulator [Ohtaekwangia koreensis]|uniref:Negative transcriptional regulator, PaiB family n=1 Tax=Ohtaekwangia koreensis TaxID=688867 RepID=A0A1T5LRD6_9BACT|nr:FMN-binding negative transcriptional regulator [Ohtaekwangia koreensis]SKC78088.1 negative transcriptional regulator, PaiB family [Ohtaekwangia koreensis]
MYTPKQFKNDNDAEIKEFVRHNGFGILVSQKEGAMLATHIPLELSEDGTKLSGHISRGNPQWKSFTTDDVLVIFNGPHTYISSSWYNHANVPTWNYIAVHAYGKINIIEDEELFNSLANLMNKYEKNSQHPVTVEKLTPEYIKRAMQGVVGFEVTITKLEATYKLSQNRDHESYNSIVHELEKRKDENSEQIAQAMVKNHASLFNT